ncbi:uncharacterized protein VNE69_10156 [Vairimorpha necatrix]|uniref:Uncharacterized protein n=1 Tax=Vairimorpha necatrix TaxID=6039 RepID=A0AAX4JG71_9MICR
MQYNHFIKNSLENIGSSFVFGTCTKLIYKSFSHYPDLYIIMECLENGLEMSKYTLLNSINIFILDKMGFGKYLLEMTSVFLTNFMINMRNGVKYAYMKGWNGVFINLIRKIIKY